MKFTCINIHGNLISEEILHKVQDGTAEGQAPSDFGIENASHLRGEIEYTWSKIKLEWKHFSERSQTLPSSDAYGTSLVRKLMSSFFDSLGFEVSFQKSNLIGGNGQDYYISHTAGNLDNLPILITGFFDPAHPEKNTLDIRSSGGTSRFSPHATIQEYLNVTEHLYGMATNGQTIRLMRDSGRLVKLTYIEFDLKRMIEEDIYSEFTLLYRLLHSTRFPHARQETEKCLIEKYFQDSIETGNRIREGLSKAVMKSLDTLGKGFITHPNNIELSGLLEEGKLKPKDFFRELMRLIYRLLFLMVTEERDLIYDSEDSSESILKKKRHYLNYYSISRLRKLSENKHLYQDEFTDLWQGLVNTFILFETVGNGIKLGIKPLGGDLFNSRALENIEKCKIGNGLLLACIANLNEFEDENHNLVPINYRSIDVEELGSVYERLLDLHPVIGIEEGFRLEEGSDRKRTGSYYTRSDLVNELIKSALVPVIDERLKDKTDVKAREKALLDLNICDPASGSGHMLLAAARTIGLYLAKTRTGEENPSPLIYREAVRDAIQHCIYAVDMNPDAVELCKLALWLESHSSGKSLSFIDHHIRCGNSLVGVTDLSVLDKGIPDEAYDPCTGDDKKLCQALKKANKQQRLGELEIIFATSNAVEEEEKRLAGEFLKIDEIDGDNIESYSEKLSRFNNYRSNPGHYADDQACNLWTAAFFHNYIVPEDKTIPTTERLRAFRKKLDGDYNRALAKAAETSLENTFFHWPLEFPDVFEQGGFDVILGNPPWEKIKLEEEQFFSTRNIAIANAKNKSERHKLIKLLPLNSPEIYTEYLFAVHGAEAESKFVRLSNRFKLSARGDINTYLLFTELAFNLKKNKKGRSGIIIPIGLVAENSSKDFFEYLIASDSIESFYCFVNTKKIFPGIKDYIKFGLLTFGRSHFAKFSFWLTDVTQIGDKQRVFSISKEEIKILNPNSKTCPIFRTNIDAQLTKKIYSKIKILDNDIKESNDWQPKFYRVFDMSNDSGEFKDEFQKGRLPLYEAKMIWNFDHRFSTYENATQSNINEGNLPQLTPEMHADPNKAVLARYYIEESSLQNRIGLWSKKWFLAFRGIAATNNERTFIYSLIPYVGAGNSAPVIIFQDSISSMLAACFLSNANALIFDYLGRQKAAGSNLNFYIVRQMPVIQPNEYTLESISNILSKLLELVYTSWDIKPFADDVWKECSTELQQILQKEWKDNKQATGGHEWNPPGWVEIDPEGCPFPPFKWDEDRRAVLKAELDAIYAKLYGLTDEELRYILDPQDVYGPDFPGETFRVLKEKEVRKYGEYRTKRLVLEAWERI